MSQTILFIEKRTKERERDVRESKRDRNLNEREL